MSDTTSTTPTTTTTETAKPAPRTNGPINKKWADELQLAEELMQVAKTEAYAAALLDEEIDDAFLTRLDDGLKAAAKLVTAATGGRADKKAITQREQALHDALIAQIQAVQKRAKRKYVKVTDPMRDKYFLGQRLDGNRALLESTARSIIEVLGKDTLPGLKPAAVAGLQTALKDYADVQTDQTGGQTDAVTAGKLLEAKVTEIAGLRRQIQYAADTLWPASNRANAAIRNAFKIPANRTLK